MQAQIGTDRYYAVHLMGELKEKRAIVVLEPLLSDPSVNYKVAWALGEIGGKSAVELLVVALHDKSSDVRVIAIDALQKLNAKESLPSLRLLLRDHEKGYFGDQVPVSDAARSAIAKLEATP